MKATNKWKRKGSGILAVCLILSLLLSNQSFGVFAAEDGTQVQAQESQVQESGETAVDKETEGKTSETASNSKEQTQTSDVDTNTEEKTKSNDADVASGEQPKTSETDTKKEDTSTPGEADRNAEEEKETSENINETDNSKENTPENNAASIGENNEEVSENAGQSSLDDVLEDADAALGEESEVVLQSEDDANLQTGTEISSLIDADVALLKWKRTKEGSVQVSVANQDYTVNDENSFETAYTAVCVELKKCATDVSEGISGQTISCDTVWNITDTVNMTGSVTINNNARLVILGDGIILRTGPYKLINKDTLCLQESVYMNGNGQSGTIVSMTSGTTYLTDNFHIGNCPDATGIVTSGGTLEMSGGLVGTKNIIFEWKDENDNLLGSKNYDDTLNYIEAQIDSNRYDYVSDVTATGGCKRGIQIGGDSQFYMSGGIVAGNIGESGLYLRGSSLITGGMIFGNLINNEKGKSSSQGGAIDCVGTSEIQILGGKIYANHAVGYGGAINVGKKTILGNDIVLAYNSALYNGGAVVVNAQQSVSVQGNARITHNTAIGTDLVELAGSGNGGAFRVVGTLEILGGIVSYNYANGKIETNLQFLNSGNGGAISAQTDSDVRIADIQLKGGYIKHNKSRENGGAIWIASMVDSLKATFSLEGTVISDNVAGKQGGGAYLAARKGDFLANIISGTVSTNSAGTSGGAIYMELGDVDGSLGKSITVNIGKNGTNDNELLISENSAKDNGGALYIGRSEKNTSESNMIDVNFYSGTMQKNSAANGGGIGIVQGALSLYGGVASSNIATENGGGAYLSGGNLNVSGGSFNENSAQNGGGVFLNAGNMTLSDGQIYNNQAVNGAGAYLHGGNLTMKGSGKFDSNVASADGGGVYLAGGALTVDSGAFNSNTATADGGGAYLAGGTLTINGGAFGGNTATNGAGAYAADGKVRMFGGNITNNTATQNGGGFYVSSDTQSADVVIRSGTISGNKAGQEATQGNGGAIAVVNKNAEAKEDRVVIGLRHKHTDLNMDTRKFTSFTYTDSIDNNAQHTHVSCPTIENNQASGNGGGIYMDSSKSILDIYCLLESNNTAVADESGGSIMSVGGNVNIGDVGDNGNGNNTITAVGNILIKSRMLVKGGAVKLYGNTDNPGFSDQILVDIQKNAGSFEDYRFTQITNAINYKIEYFENFEGSGTFTAMQYEENADIPAMGTMYVHEGYKIIGWAKSGSATNPDYTTGQMIGTKDDHSAWRDIENTGALKLYAIWQKISYIVAYHANENTYSGSMVNQSFVYGDEQSLSENAFKVTGKRFLNWNTRADGSGTSYAGTYNESKMTGTDGATIDLYAQWVDCTHKGGDHDGTLSYSVNDAQDMITEVCDCGGHTATLKISGADVYYDGASHPAALAGTLLAGNQTVTYLYKAIADGDYSGMTEETTEPTKEGYYQASITVGGKTAFAKYQIKSAASAATIDVAAKKSQHFTDINGSNACTVAQDDAFTVQYQVQALNAGANDTNKKVFVTAPVLTLSEELPVGTTIIMQTGNSYYWYKGQPREKEITLTSFTKMGGTDSFLYNSSDIADGQTYRFIIDFSGVQENAHIAADSLMIGLKYAYTNPQNGEKESAHDKEEKATITVQKKTDFKVEVNSETNQVTVTAPANDTDTRWERKNLVWKVTPSATLPSDAKLTVTTKESGVNKTIISSLNSNGEFIVPFDWSENKVFTFALSSDQEAMEGSSYALSAALYVGSRSQEASQPAAGEDGMQKASGNVNLTIPVNKAPSLKISGEQKVLSRSDTLKVNITYSNVDADGYSITGVIRKKDSNGAYNESSDFGRITIDHSGDTSISLASVDSSGSYCLWITVSKKVAGGTNQTLLEVPYYFIVQ